MIKEQGFKKFPKPSYGQKLYTGHPCLSSQFFEKRSVLYVHSSTFNVSVYAPYYTTQLVKIMDLPGKKAKVYEAIAYIKAPEPSYQESDGRYTV